MTLFETAWKSYEQSCMRPSTSVAQRIEMRRAFYAGAATTLNAVLETGEDHISEDAGVETLESMKADIAIFTEKVKNGQA